MEGMIFYSLDDLNRALLKKTATENWKPFKGLPYSRYDLFTPKEKATLLPCYPTTSNILNARLVKVAQNFSFAFGKVHYSMLQESLHLPVFSRKMWEVAK